MAIDTTSIGTAPRTLDPTPTPSAPIRSSSGADRAPGHPAAVGPGLIRYQPALDGLRAVAVLAVLAYHWPAAWMPGGFLGVEVFFVISGYLITSLLLGERVRTGATDLKRVLDPPGPAAAARARSRCSWWCRSLWLIVAPRREVAGLRGDVLAALAYVTNWYLIAVKQSYFESVGRPSPLLHLWSLAVEEQFYLIWPLVLVGLLRVFRRRMRLVLVAIAGARRAGSAVLGMVLYHPARRSVPHLVRHRHARRRRSCSGAALAIAVPPWRMRLTSSPPRAAPAQRARPSASWPAWCGCSSTSTSSTRSSTTADSCCWTCSPWG